MCECLEYDDGSMHLCEVDADIYREFQKSREDGLPWPLPEWMLDAILVHEKGVMAAQRVAFEQAAKIAQEAGESDGDARRSAALFAIATKIRARCDLSQTRDTKP